MHQVADIIEGKELIYVNPSDSVRKVVQRMADKNIGAVPVLDGGKLVGMFTERDVMTRVVAKDRNPDQTTVASVMTKQIVAAEPGESIEECIQKMRSASCRHLPVVDKGKLIGMISLRDLLQVDVEEKEEKVEFLRELVTYSADYES